LFVGSLLRSKGIDLLLHALWKLQQPFHCEIIGQGAQEHSFRLWADALGFGKGSRSHQCVQFVGWRSPEALHDHYQRADILVLPSRSPETFGLVGLEAMHHGLPVIAFDVGGVSEWLQHGHTGYLVPPGDLSALADRLSQLIEDPKKRAAFSEHAQQRAASCFSFEKHLDAFVRML
jgi:glycosyltransferase involved in cell wall biosynthesis